MSLRDAEPVRDRLRRTTQAAHERMHRHEGFAGAASGRLSLAAYRDLLARLYGFHRAFEATFDRAPADFAEAIRLPARARSADLARDLATLGDGPSVERLPLCQTLILPRTEAEWLGSLYVTEGATLGGAQIARALEGLGPGEDGRRFFLAYGEQRSLMWRLFLSRLETIGAHEVSATQAEHSALRMFEAFETWMRDWRDASQCAEVAI